MNWNPIIAFSTVALIFGTIGTLTFLQKSWTESFTDRLDSWWIEIPNHAYYFTPVITNVVFQHQGWLALDGAFHNLTEGSIYHIVFETWTFCDGCFHPVYSITLVNVTK
jgi:hypothetical protein